MMKIRLLSVVAGLFLAVCAQANTALPQPSGDIVLTVKGQITRTNGDGAARFDRDMLRAIGFADIETETIWTQGMQVFTGVPLAALLKYVGATGTTIVARAINDYSVSIPVSDATNDGPILAIEHNGRVMSLREKGPIWVIYPYSSSSAFRSEVIYSRSIWQLDTMTIGD